MHPLFEKYKLDHISASQIKTFKRSPFTWICEKVLGMRSPDSEATTFGTFIHENFELRMELGDTWSGEVKLPKECEEFHCEAWDEKLEKFYSEYMRLKPENEETQALEQEISFEIHKDLPPVIGKIDVTTYVLDEDGDVTETILEDHKTIGNKSFAPKTGKDLLKEDQMIIYGSWYIRSRHVGSVTLRHNQLFKKIKRKPVNLLPVKLTEEKMEERMAGIVADALRMIDALEVYDEKGIEGVAVKYEKQYNKTKYDFGGCKLYPFFQDCLRQAEVKALGEAPEPEELDNNIAEEKEEDMKDLHKMLKQAKDHIESKGLAKNKFEVAEVASGMILAQIQKNNVEAAYVRSGGSSGDVVHNQTLNLLAENGIRLYEKLN